MDIEYVDIKDVKDRKRYLKRVLKYDRIVFVSPVIESFEAAVEEAANQQGPIYFDYKKIEVGVVRDKKKIKRIISDKEKLSDPEKALKKMKKVIDSILDDKYFIIYSDRYVYNDVSLHNGYLEFVSEVEGEDGYHSENHIIFSKEDTKKLFTVLTWDEFIQLVKKDDDNKLSEIYEALDIKAEGCTI